MDTTHLVYRVQAAYPCIYGACHTRHARRTENLLSPRDAMLLAHLGHAGPVSQTDLARHLKIGKSTLSEAVKRLARAGHVALHDGPDGRTRLLSLSECGRDALGASSVLETDLLAQLLATLTLEEAAFAVAGLEKLAEAALRLGADHPEAP